MLAAAYQKLMGHPFVYDRVRPFLLGGIEYSTFYRKLADASNAVILDIGCGTGNALEYLTHFRSYHGFDTDAAAVAAARRKHAGAAGIEFAADECTHADVQRIAPTHVVLCGVLHHLRDEVAVGLMQSAAASPRFSEMYTLDVAYLPGPRHWLSNALSALDRGKHVRTPDGYARLFVEAGLHQTETQYLWNHPKRHMARYFVTTLNRNDGSSGARTTAAGD